MLRCPSCGNEFLVLCAEDGLCRNCSDCCTPVPPAELQDRKRDV